MCALNRHQNWGYRFFSFAPVLLRNMRKVGGWCTCTIWGRSSELSILIALSIKQKRQLGDSGRARHCRSPLVYFASHSALFLCFPAAAYPVPLLCLLLLAQQWPLRGPVLGGGGCVERWRRQKRVKGEHLVCRALIRVALGERALPTFPHKTHAQTHVRIFSRSNSQWWLAPRQCLSGAEKRECVVQTTAGVAVWMGWQKVCRTLCHCGTVHYPNP